MDKAERQKTRRRFYVSRDCIREGFAVLPSEQAHHLRNVLRLKTGDEVELFDGEGGGYCGLVEAHGDAVFVRELKRTNFEQLQSRLVLAAALIKSAKFEFILQKATELGVAEIIPLYTRFCEIEIPRHKIEARLERWRRILQEASKQSRRFVSPVLRPPIEFSDFLGLAELSCCSKFLFYEKAEAPWSFQAKLANDIVLCVGPEGGWDVREVEQAKEAGFDIKSLGPWVLRAETAAIASLSIVQTHVLSNAP